jgi:hypothetical protein
VSGVVSIADLANPAFELTARMRDFNVIDRGGVGDIHVSSADAGGLRLAGAVNGSRLTGGVVVSRADIAIPELAQKNVVSLDDPEFFKLVDTTLSTNRTLLPEAPPALLRNLSVGGVGVEMGSDVWLRSSEANINLGGALRVSTVASRDATTAPALTLDGTLRAARGTYRLNVGVALQRTFEVESGTLRFYETDADINPTLDVSAVHTVRQFNRGARDVVRVRVRIGGTLAQPTLALESADPTLQLSQSDLISYLVTGAPSFDVAGGAGRHRVVGAAAEHRRAAGRVARRRRRLRPDRDRELARRAGWGRDRPHHDEPHQRHARGRGWQIGDNQFLSANLGLCQVGNVLSGSAGGFSAQDFSQSIGLKYEYRFPRALTLSAGVEPPTNAVFCSPAGTAGVRNFVPTPRQFGVDLLRRWEF